MIDVRIDSQDGNFKFRVAGVLKYEDKYLFVKMNENDFYCLPGGHVELGEDTEMAVLREMNEELGFPVQITKFLGETQNFFNKTDGKIFHEIAYYYQVEAISEKDVTKKDFTRLENDKGFIQHLEFKWLTKEEMKNVKFRPPFLMKLFEGDNPKHDWK